MLLPEGSALVFLCSPMKNGSTSPKNYAPLPMTDRRAQDFLRMLFAGASECEPDKQGRILLPQRLREHAGIEKEVVIIGVMSRMEIWSKQNWDTYNEKTYSDFEQTLLEMSELGI